MLCVCICICMYVQHAIAMLVELEFPIHSRFTKTTYEIMNFKDSSSKENHSTNNLHVDSFF